MIQHTDIALLHVPEDESGIAKLKDDSTKVTLLLLALSLAYLGTSTALVEA